MNVARHRKRQPQKRTKRCFLNELPHLSSSHALRLIAVADWTFDPL